MGKGSTLRKDNKPSWINLKFIGYENNMCKFVNKSKMKYVPEKQVTSWMKQNPSYKLNQ